MENLKTNNRKKIIIFSIATMLVLLMGSAYAFFTYSKIGSKNYIITLRNAPFTIAFSSGKNVVNFKNAYPLEDDFATDNLDKLTYIDFEVSGRPKTEGQSINYEIYLTLNEDNTLNSDFVKVYLEDEEGNAILEPTLFSSLNNTTNEENSNGKVIYSTSTDKEFSTKYRLYTWLDSNYSQNDTSETFGFKVNLYAYNGTTDLVYKDINSSINNSSCSNTTKALDGTVYLTGDNDCVNYNYISYSNNLWRVVAINPDNSLKLVSENPVTTYSGEEVSVSKEDVNEYLNNEFSNTLNNKEQILNSTENTVSLLSVDDYNSIKGSTSTVSYLNTNSNWLVDGTGENTVVGEDGNIKESSNSLSIRPTINLKSNIRVASGTGTKNDPYQIMP